MKSHNRRIGKFGINLLHGVTSVCYSKNQTFELKLTTLVSNININITMLVILGSIPKITAQHQLQSINISINELQSITSKNNRVQTLIPF